jgi:hypothetical protein
MRHPIFSCLSNAKAGVFSFIVIIRHEWRFIVVMIGLLFCCPKKLDGINYAPLLLDVKIIWLLQ